LRRLRRINTLWGRGDLTVIKFLERVIKVF
jgi:hypothetical protein